MVLAACAPAADSVLVLETSPGMGRWLAETTLPRLQPGDAMGIVTFAGKPKLIQPMTDDAARLARALRRLRESRGGFGVSGRSPARDAQVYAAVARAAGVLGPKGGRIVLLFGSEERQGRPAPAELQRMLTAGGIRLDVAAVRRRLPLKLPYRTAQTPPTIPGRYPPVDAETLPLPQATLEVLRGLSRATGGEAVTGTWNLRALLAKSPARG
jgi:hypothetical protein